MNYQQQSSQLFTIVATVVTFVGNGLPPLPLGGSETNGIVGAWGRGVLNVNSARVVMTNLHSFSSFPFLNVKGN